MSEKAIYFPWQVCTALCLYDRISLPKRTFCGRKGFSESLSSAVNPNVVLLQGIAEQRQFLQVINAFNAPLSWLRVLKYMEELSPKTRQVVHHPSAT